MKRGNWKHRWLLALIGVLVVSIALGGTALAGKKKGEGKGWLGVYIQDIDEDAMEAWDLDTEDGVIVSDIVEDSPAEEAGLESGDVIIKFNGKNATSTSRLTRMIRKIKPDTEVKIDIIRDRENKELTVTLGEREEDWAFLGDDDWTWRFDAPHITIPKIKPLKPGRFEFYGVGARGWIGVQLRDLNDQLGEYFGVEDGEGALVEEVVDDSPAEKAGIKAGDVIVEINGEEVADVDDVVDQISDLDEGDTAEITVLRQSSRQTFSVEVEEGEGFGDYRRAVLKYEKSLPRVFKFEEGDLEDLDEPEDVDELREELREVQEELREAMKELHEELREALEEAREEIEEALEALREGG